MEPLTKRPGEYTGTPEYHAIAQKGRETRSMRNSRILSLPRVLLYSLCGDRPICNQSLEERISAVRARSIFDDGIEYLSGQVLNKTDRDRMMVKEYMLNHPGEF